MEIKIKKEAHGTLEWVTRLLTECTITSRCIYWPGLQWGIGVCVIRPIKQPNNMICVTEKP